MSGDLEAEMFAASQSLRLLHLKALARLGVPWDFACELSGAGSAGIVHASEGDDETYHLDPQGAAHLVIPVSENGEMVDLVAFRSGDPAKWLLRNGTGWALGLHNGLERLTWGDPVTLHKTPLDWLRAGADGLCIIDWSAPELCQLCGIHHLVCEDAEHAKRLTQALTRPAYLPKISIKELARYAA